jgi:hypothetical protein
MSPGGGVRGTTDGQSITVTATNGATRIYIDWPDGTFADYPLPADGKLRIEIPQGMKPGVVVITDMDIPDPSSDSFCIDPV